MMKPVLIPDAAPAEDNGGLGIGPVLQILGNVRNFLEIGAGSGINICLFALSPPVRPVHWDVGPLTKNVFEESVLTRYIYHMPTKLTSGTVMYVRNPVNRTTTPYAQE